MLTFCKYTGALAIVCSWKVWHAFSCIIIIVNIANVILHYLKGICNFDLNIYLQGLQEKIIWLTKFKNFK
jgi:hypothetical protein